MVNCEDHLHSLSTSTRLLSRSVTKTCVRARVCLRMRMRARKPAYARTLIQEVPDSPQETILLFLRRRQAFVSYWSSRVARQPQISARPLQQPAVTRPVLGSPERKAFFFSPPQWTCCSLCLVTCVYSLTKPNPCLICQVPPPPPSHTRFRNGYTERNSTHGVFRCPRV